jgi:hypothetical protein
VGHGGKASLFLKICNLFVWTRMEVNFIWKL